MSTPLSRSHLKRAYEVSQRDLPLACPSRTDRLWDSHPRVYLPIDKIGHITCPYCGTDYFLKDDKTN